MEASFLAACLALLPGASRDGMPIENGRFIGGPTTVITLDADQVRTLEGGQRELVLTEAQRVTLKRAAGTAPRKLLVYDTRKSENDCCCDASNRGLRFSARQLEIPHRYLDTEDAATSVPKGYAWLFAGALVAVGLAIIAVRLVHRPSQR